MLSFGEFLKVHNPIADGIDVELRMMRRYAGNTIDSNGCAKR
jgi:hypothetical protein